MAGAAGTTGKSELENKLDAARKDLLDLGLRNPLINYRPLKSRGVQIVDERSVEIFKILVSQGKKMTFLPAPESKVQQEIDYKEQGTHLDQPGDETLDARRHTDTKLQTSLASASLQTRLLNTYYAARTSIEEQGINILYLALGMLQWFEGAVSQEVRRAPLLLLPVSLERSSASERFQLAYTGEDIGTNLSLAEKLKNEFSIRLPELPDAEELDPRGYFDAVRKAVRREQRWEVNDDQIALGFFSFSKLLMYRDLDPRSWPETAKLEEHSVLHGLLDGGFSEPSFDLSEEDHLDDRLDPRHVHHVVDADSSQILAIMQVNSGSNLVIQGPPGTGKSQTITNLIAEAIGRGKTVLFVSEKMAALDVVKRRLDAIGIGDACLELHSQKANKKAVLAELQRTLELGRPSHEGAAQELEELVSVRTRLNAYADALNEPIANSGITPYRALGELSRSRRSHPTLPGTSIPGLTAWSQSDYRERKALLGEMQEQLKSAGAPSKNPFWGSQLEVLLPSQVEALDKGLAEASKLVAMLQSTSASLAELLAASTPSSLHECKQLNEATIRFGRAPKVTGMLVESQEWVTKQNDLREAIRAGKALAELHERRRDAVHEEAWGQPLGELKQTLASLGGKWWRQISGRYRSAKHSVRQLFRDEPPKELDAVLEVLEDIMAAQKEAEAKKAVDDPASRLFGSEWSSANPDWGALTEALDYLSALQEEIRIGRTPPGAPALIAGGRVADAARLEAVASEAIVDYERTIASLVELLRLDEAQTFSGSSFLSQPLAEQVRVLAAWTTDRDRLHQLVSFNQLAKSCREQGLDPLVTLAETNQEAASLLVPTLAHRWHLELYEQALRVRPPLALFDGERQGQLAERFRTLDAQVLSHTRGRLAKVHWESLPEINGAGQVGILTREFNKKRRHLPIRQLMARAGIAAQAIKPVFMMSPLSIAAFLEPGGLSFDIVIFDEASQVKPVDGLGAILRARQAVVVGDDKQLPPTAFFEAVMGQDDLDDSESTGDIESILGLFRAQGARQAMLRWHYRSRHESLIAVSNHEFYSDKLVVFPSPTGDRRELGLAYHHVPGGIYDRGRSRKNLIEARVVAEAVMAHAQQQLQLPPERQQTLGVVAFSMAQMEAVQDQLELLRRAAPNTESYFSGHPHEPFFVKNLENVQGDERDVIFISVGYGRNREGLVAMDFGPLNRPGGERRLNVLITRARLRCDVFTNLTADDIDLDRSDRQGVRALKTFLAYAETGLLGLAEPGPRDDESPFEDEVHQALQSAGYTVDRQVGSAGFFIDLAVKDPEKPGRYLLGIECDGATYHSARSARDRDRLRQQVLEGLGWRIHRIWSTSWFRNPGKELERTIESIEKAKLDAKRRAQDSPPPRRANAPTMSGVARDTRLPTSPPRSAAIPYKLARPQIALGGLELHQVPTEQMASWVAEVVTCESPIHIDELCRRVTEAAGFARVGSRIKEAIEQACLSASRRGLVKKRGDFYWSPEMAEPPIRDRSEFSAQTRKLERIAPEEITAAVLATVENCCGIESPEAPAEACRLLGFGRCSADMSAKVQAEIKKLVRNGRLMNQGGHLVVGSQ